MLWLLAGCAPECEVAGVVASPRPGFLTVLFERQGEARAVNPKDGTFDVLATCGSPVRVERRDGMLTYVSPEQPAEDGPMTFALPERAAGGFWLGLDGDVVTRVYPGATAQGRVALGDRLVALDGVELDGGALPPGLEWETHQLTVERDGVRHTFEIQRHYFPASSPPWTPQMFPPVGGTADCQRVATGEGWAVEAQARRALWRNPWDVEALGQLRAAEQCPPMEVRGADNLDTNLVHRCARVSPMPDERTGTVVVSDGLVVEDSIGWPEFRWCLDRGLQPDSTLEAAFKSGSE